KPGTVHYLLKLCETELILMDEFHHLFDMQKVSRKMNIDVCNWIKTVTDSTNISSCLIGLPEFAPLLQIDSQLARRFPLTFKLSRLNIGSTQSPGTLYGFLSQVEQNIEKRLTLKFLPRLIDPLFVLQIYASTKGYHHYIISLIREAMLFALLADSDVITQQHFSLAWDKGITSYTNMTTQNPFHMDTSKLVQRMKGDH
ncbi:TniB family NTP-binding protein, partial [Acinetobacter baumannii]|uniref:TniB family NTP-binding protein n=2 Tax=Acinetobacter baumannii TaxID=470 RepID=UPI000A9540D4